MEGAKLDAPGYYIRWLSANDKVYGFPFSEKWYDIGDLESYKRADEEYTKKGE
jgi:glucose-1-phosphate thymidylyltransferase